MMELVSNSLSTVFSNLENIVSSQALDTVIIFKNQQCPLGCVLYVQYPKQF